MKEIKSTRQLIGDIGDLASTWQDVVQRYDEMFGAAANLGPAERRCLTCLWSSNRSPFEIARKIGLAPSSVTALVDRLEARGLVVRTADPGDRRRTIVSLTKKARSLAEQAYGQLAHEGSELLRRYSDEELHAVERYLKDAIHVQQEAISRLETESSTSIHEGGASPSVSE